MTHPLINDLTAVSFEELEKRKSDILSRMQRLRIWGQGSSEMWDQFQSILGSLDLEMEQRLSAQDTAKTPSKNVIVNTDPLEEELEDLAKQKRGPKQYTIL